MHEISPYRCSLLVISDNTGHLPRSQIRAETCETRAVKHQQTAFSVGRPGLDPGTLGLKVWSVLFHCVPRRPIASQTLRLDQA
jgi:hypothetical protein